jgi:hypothetical protein
LDELLAQIADEDPFGIDALIPSDTVPAAQPVEATAHNDGEVHGESGG